MWSLGIVLFALLSGGYVPFGHRGLCQACIHDMPGPSEKMDKMQEWLEVGGTSRVNPNPRYPKQPKLRTCLAPLGSWPRCRSGSRQFSVFEVVSVTLKD